MSERRDPRLLWRLLAVLLALSLVAAACGDDDDETAGGPTTTAADGEEEPPTFEVPASCTDDTATGDTATDDTATDDTATDDTATDDTATDDTATDDTATDDTATDDAATGDTATDDAVAGRQGAGATAPLVAPPHPQAGGDFVDLQNFSFGDPGNIDPVLAQTLEAAQIGYIVFDGLTDTDPETAELEPAVAESWTSNDEATEWTFQLREGVTFSNGEPVLPSSFKCAWERAAQPAMASPTAYHLNFIDGKEAVDAGDTVELSGVTADDDAMTLTVRLAAPFADFPYVVSHVVYSPVSKQQVVELGEDQADLDSGVMIGNGPFAMSEPWERERHVRLERNEQYWGGTDNHLAALDTLEFRISKDIDSAYNEFEAGQGHNAGIPSGRFAEATGKYPSATDPILSTYFFLVNQDDEVLGGEENRPLRQAISLAIDRQAINEAAYDGSRRLPTGLTPPGIPGFEGGLCGELCPETPQLDEAQQLLDEWGGELPSEPIKVQFNADAGHEEVAAIMIDGLAELGIAAEQEPHDSQTYFPDMAGGACQLCRAGWAWDFPLYDNPLYSLFHSDTIGADNIARYSSPEYDAKIDEARRTLDETTRRQLYRDAERILLEDVPVIVINWYNGDIVYREGVESFVLSPLDLVAYDRVTLAS